MVGVPGGRGWWCGGRGWSEARRRKTGVRGRGARRRSLSRATETPNQENPGLKIFSFGLAFYLVVLFWEV